MVSEKLLPLCGARPPKTHLRPRLDARRCYVRCTSEFRADGFTIISLLQPGRQKEVRGCLDDLDWMQQAERGVARQAVSVERQRSKLRRPKRKADARPNLVAHSLNISPCRSGSRRRLCISHESAPSCAKGY